MERREKEKRKQNYVTDSQGFYKWIYERFYIRAAEKDYEDINDHRSYLHNLSSCEI